MSSISCSSSQSSQSHDDDESNYFMDGGSTAETTTARDESGKGTTTASTAGDSTGTTSPSGSVVGGDGEIGMLMQSMDYEDDVEEEGGYDDHDRETKFITPNIERALSMTLSEMKLTIEIDDEGKQQIEEEEAQAVAAKAAAATSSVHPAPPSSWLSREVCYGHPLSPEEASNIFPPNTTADTTMDGGNVGGGGDYGLTRHALLINGDPFDEKTGKLKKGLNPRDFDLTKKTIKPYRASLPILSEDFYSSLTRVEGTVDGNGNKLPPKFVFHGILNGWPSITDLEVVRIEKRREKESWHPSALVSGQRVWTHMWSSSQEGARGEDPIIKEKGLLFRITFRGPSWTREGWSKSSPGFAFWYSPQIKLDDGTNRFLYGTDMNKVIARSDEESSSRCTHVHMVAHRYAKLRENPKDKFTYHALVFLEWDHGQYGTIVEAAYLNGLGGYRGKCNWFHDLKSPVTEMYKSFPPELVSPWSTSKSEIRTFDCPHIKSIHELKAYIDQYTGHDQRFLDPNYYFSAPARLSYRSKTDISLYLNNYIRRDVSYNQLTRNCQTFCADLCAFLAGKKEVLPYHPVNRIEYRNRTHLFLYEPTAYDSSDSKKGRQESRRKGSFLMMR